MRTAERKGARWLVLLVLLVMLGALSGSVGGVNEPGAGGPAGCGTYASWRTSVGMGDPRGSGPTPRDAVRALVDESVTVGDVVSQTRWLAEVRVSHRGVPGVYQLWRVDETWRVYGGDGCPASAGAPMIPEGYHCTEPDEEALAEGQAVTVFCSDTPFHSPSDGYYSFP